MVLRLRASRCCSTSGCSGNLFFAIAVLLPWAVPAIAASAIFKWLFDSRYGFVNWALVNLGFEGFTDYAWFAGRFSAYVAIFVTVVWQSFPFIALSLLAGLQTIPKETLHAAAVDGAGPWQPLPAGDAPAAAADHRRAGRLLHDLGLQDLRPDLRDGRRACPTAPRTPPRSPPTARASRSPLRAGLARSRSCCS